jgi:hypothetical protein
VKKPGLAARKIARIPLAFGSPQDFHIALMFGAARFGEPELSGSRRVGFRIAPRRPRSPRRAGTRHKWFNRHRIFDATRTLAAPCGLNACSGAGFRGQSRASGRGLPLVCRNAPKVCCKTQHMQVDLPDMQLKCFRQQAICHSRNRFFVVIASEAKQSRRAAKQDWIASSQVLLAMTGVSIS